MATATRNNRVDTLEAITSSLQSFKGGSALYDSATSLLGTLGYRSQKVQRLSSPTFEGFKEAFSVGSDAIKNDKALTDQWSRIDFLFQLGDTELGGIASRDDVAKPNKNVYQSFLFVAIELKSSEYKRADLVAITRELNKPFYMPVIVLFYYGDKLTLSIIDRRLHKRDNSRDVLEKVTLIRDIHLAEAHRAHIEILADLSLPMLNRLHTINSFVTLHEGWKNTLNISELNKRFYKELSNWYFWASKHVAFPGAPTVADAHRKGADLNELIQEHHATNIIRLLTRLLFVWFIKEKKLIPDELFDLAVLQKDILKDISPYHETGMFKESNKDSVYYKAILQNLFFATLNCPIEADSIDKRKRGFRGDGYGTHRGIDYLMRYKQYFKDPGKFLGMMNDVVPFLNGGLFECLDDKYQNVYIDGFSDQMAQGEQLIVPDYIFFGVEEKVDLSKEYGVSNAGTKKAAVKGLINILKSYKFTITENTPIEEEVALDPELLGKVFENLLASYNPETRTTARKQTGSFYTPREIVDYMVDESLIAFLKTAIADWGEFLEEDVDKELRVLTSFDQSVPFRNKKTVQTKIIQALSRCTILDPACGSGAFPMGILQKIVHILQKLDPDNKIWREVQLDKARSDSDAAFDIDDKKAREERLLEINEAFDQSMNDPDYARKLFLIENCIYGVDIQPIATQISKLRFFISLVVEQKVTAGKEENFGIRPLPNLETKFVAANTLVDIEKPKAQTSLFDTARIKELEAELKTIRSRLFNARTKDTKLKYRQKDLELRTAIAAELKKTGWPNDAADKLASWDPYDQNNASLFFDPEWMFDIKDGFDIVIGNPPYVRQEELTDYKPFLKTHYKIYSGTADLYVYFVEAAFNLLRKGGHLAYIIQDKWMQAGYGKPLRGFLLEQDVKELIDFGDIQIFESATAYACILIVSKGYVGKRIRYTRINEPLSGTDNLKQRVSRTSTAFVTASLTDDTWMLAGADECDLLKRIWASSIKLEEYINGEAKRGILTGLSAAFIKKNDQLSLDQLNKKELGHVHPFLLGRAIKPYVAGQPEHVLLLFKNKETSQLYSTQSEARALSQLKEDMPQIMEHLLPYKQDAIIRTDKGQFWWELRPCDYYAKFEVPKIMYQKFQVKPCFIFDDQGLYCNDSMWIIAKDDKALLGILNSRLGWWLISKYCTKIQNGYQLIWKYFGQIPIPRKINGPEGENIHRFVDQILVKKKAGAETFKEENEINRLVYNLYGVNEEDIDSYA